jgi:hypothetical protein
MSVRPYVKSWPYSFQSVIILPLFCCHNDVRVVSSYRWDNQAAVRITYRSVVIEFSTSADSCIFIIDNVHIHLNPDLMCKSGKLYFLLKSELRNLSK